MSRCESINIYGLPATSDRMAELLREGTGNHSERQRHIARKKAAIRKRKRELGLETGVTQVPHDGVRVIAVGDIGAVMRDLEP